MASDLLSIGASGARARGVGLPLSLILFGGALLFRRER